MMLPLTPVPEGPKVPPGRCRYRTGSKYPERRKGGAPNLRLRYCADAALHRSLLHHAGAVFPDGQQGGARRAWSDEPLQSAGCLPWTVPGQEQEVARGRSVHRACGRSDRLAPGGHLTPTQSPSGAQARSCAGCQPPEAAPYRHSDNSLVMRRVLSTREATCTSRAPLVLAHPESWVPGSWAVWPHRGGSRTVPGACRIWRFQLDRERALGASVPKPRFLGGS